MQHNAAVHQGQHCVLRLKQPSGTNLHHNLENSTCDPLKYTIGSPIHIESICMGKSIRILRVNQNRALLLMLTSDPLNCIMDHSNMLSTKLDGRF